MFTFFFIPTILILVAISLVLRLVIRPVLNAYRIRHPYYGPYEYNGYSRGYGRHRFGGLLSILALVALDRIVGRRW